MQVFHHALPKLFQHHFALYIQKTAPKQVPQVETKAVAEDDIINQAEDIFASSEIASHENIGSEVVDQGSALGWFEPVSGHQNTIRTF